MSDYHFLTLKDAITCINQKVNLIAIIAEFSPPQKSKGTDYFCKLKIIDESHPMPRIPVHLFASQINHLPLVSSVGDIIFLSRVTGMAIRAAFENLGLEENLSTNSYIRDSLITQLCVNINFTKMKMTIHDGDAYAIFNKKFSSFALYDGKYGDNFHPYKVSLRFQARKPNEKIIAGLRKWLASSEVIDVVPNFLLLREIDQVGFVNLACKVLHTCKTTNDEWVVFLWDGTDAPPMSTDNMLEDEMQNPLPLHFEPLPLSKDVLCTFPTVGSVFRVILDVECITYTLPVLKVGQWMKLFRVSCKVHEGLWYGVFTSSSMIRDMPNDDIEILDRQRNHNRRLLNKLDRMPYWSCPWPSRITEVSCGNVPFATLMDVLTCENVLHPWAFSFNQKVMKFRCVIRFVAAIPWRVEDFRSTAGTYRVRFTLEDPTARIHAFAYAEDGENFFDGSSTDVLKQKLIELLGVNISADGNEIIGGARNPPWVQCCLKSHNLRKCHWICDTKLVGFKLDTR